MSLKTLHDLLIHEIQDLHSAEMQLTEALPKMAKAAKTPELRTAFEEHLEETKQQLEQVQQILAELEIKPNKTKCLGMAGIIKEGEETMKKDGEVSVKDASLIGAAQRVEHYEIAGYGTARTLADVLGLTEIAAALERILEQEKATDEKLTDIAETINHAAAEEARASEDRSRKA